MTVETKVPVVLLHALSLDSSMWRHQAAALRALGVRVIAPDLLGHVAVTSDQTPPSLDVIADDVARRLDEEGIDDVVLVGCSLGGYVAMVMARRHPERIRALALLSTRAAADPPQMVEQRERFAKAILDPNVRDHLVTQSAATMLGATARARRPELLAEVLATARAASPERIAWAQRAIGSRPDMSPGLRALDVPAVVVVGAEDTLVGHVEAEATARVLPRGRLLSLEDSGHLAPLEAPDRVTAVLRELIDSAAAATPNGAR